ncbi:AMP-binding enzyme-like protein 14 [Elsinoe fawcettii]|nr:AMP-binding enzyme-like protein 14 [Elsinoe fawcettii]
MSDRTKLVPPHTGPNILPWNLFFTRLLRFAHERPPRLAIRDVVANTEASYLQLLSDVLRLRVRLLEILPTSAVEKLQADEEVFISVLAAGGYEYAVAVLAVLATGAAVVPISVALSPVEALYYASKSRSIAVVHSQHAAQQAEELERLMQHAGQIGFRTLAAFPSCFGQSVDPDTVFISSNRCPDPYAAGVVIFTSGTTGPPKGAVMRRTHYFDEAQGVADHYQISSSDVLLHLLPVHHATGVGMMFFPFLIAGAAIEFRSGGFDPAWTWDRLKRQGLTFFSAVPTIYMRMKRYFEEKLQSAADISAYVQGAQSLKVCMCGTSALPQPIDDFWTKILGKRIMLRFGGTEFGATIRHRVGDNSVPDGSIGEITPGVELKLSNGNEGEILTRGPWMFSRYLDDPVRTAEAHTEQGFYKTGDIGRREGKYFWIMGRASVDIIKSGGYKISALDVEREILSFPYVQEVMVVGVEDEEFGQRVAAAVVPREGKISLEQLRLDLKARLAGYKMPTLLRLVDELPKSGTGKVVKKTLGPQIFPRDYLKLEAVQVWDARKGDTKARNLKL